MRNVARWLVTYLAWFGAFAGGLVAVAGLANGKAGWAIVGGAVAVASVAWLKRLPTFTPRPGGPGSDL